MQHCGQASGDMWSLRDKSGKPHVTLDVVGNQAVQIRGKQNQTPDGVYWKYIEEFCKKFEVFPADREAEPELVDRLQKAAESA